jgi:hypothetical protein
LKKSALLHALPLSVLLGLVSCGGGSKSSTAAPSKLTERVLASQSASSPTAFSGLILIDGQFDTVGRGGVSTGGSPGLMAISANRSTLLAFDSLTNKVDVVNTLKESETGSIQLPGLTTSMVVPQPAVGYAAVPSAALIGYSPGAVVQMNLTAGGIAATISVPGAQTVVSNSTGSQLLAFSNDSDAVTVVTPASLNTSTPATVSVPGFDRPVYGIFNSDGSEAYILNCGAECMGTQASVQILDLTTSPPTAGAAVAVDAATIGLISGSTLYVAGTPPTNNPCTGESTAATTCGRLDVVDLNSMTVTNKYVITDGYHNRIDMGNGGQLFIGSHTCTNIGDVNNVTGEVRGCLSILNTTNGNIVIPPDNGDVTGLQDFSSRQVEYVAEGGNLRVYYTVTDALLTNYYYITTGTIIIPGYITDIKAVDFF